MRKPVLELLAMPVQLDLTPVPEIKTAMLEDALSRMITPLSKRKKYGAFVVRSGGEDTVNAAISIIEKTSEYNQLEYSIEKKLFWDKKSLHSDTGALGYTTHHTLRGSVEFLMMLGGPSPRSVTSFCKENKLYIDDVTKQLFDSNLYPFTPPQQLLYVALDPGDVLVFQEENLHATQSMTENRLSEATYWNRVEQESSM